MDEVTSLLPWSHKSAENYLQELLSSEGYIPSACTERRINFFKIAITLSPEEQNVAKEFDLQ